MKPPHEFKIMRVRECIATELVDTPESAAQLLASQHSAV